MQRKMHNRRNAWWHRTIQSIRINGSEIWVPLWFVRVEKGVSAVGFVVLERMQRKMDNRRNAFSNRNIKTIRKNWMESFSSIFFFEGSQSSFLHVASFFLQNGSWKLDDRRNAFGDRKMERTRRIDWRISSSVVLCKGLERNFPC